MLSTHITRHQQSGLGPTHPPPRATLTPGIPATNSVPSDTTEIHPLLFVHGFGGRVEEFETLAEHFSGSPDMDGVFRADQEDPFRAAVRKGGSGGVYAIEFSNPKASYRRLARELTRALAILEQETGREVDIVAHSQGGLVSRLHLDGPRDSVRRLVMIGTPNQGTRNVNFGKWAARTGRSPFAQEPFKEAMADLGPVQKGNPLLGSLNERWATQKAKLEKALIIAGTGLPTLPGDGIRPETGDGAVSLSSTYLPDLPREVLEPERRVSLEYNHRSLLNHAEVLSRVEEFLERPTATSPGKSPTNPK